jgi:hypothetical protein
MKGLELHTSEQGGLRKSSSCVREHKTRRLVSDLSTKKAGNEPPAGNKPPAGIKLYQQATGQGGILLKILVSNTKEAGKKSPAGNKPGWNNTKRKDKSVSGYKESRQQATSRQRVRVEFHP